MRIVWVLKDIGYVLNQYLIFHVAPESEGHPCVFRQTHNLILLWWIVTIL